MIGEKAKNKYQIIFLSSLLDIAVFEAGGQDRGELSLELRKETRTNIFRDGRSVIAYN